MRVTTQERAEMLRRLRLGNLRTLFQHRYGPTLPDDDAGREDLRELLLPISVGPNADIKMPNAIEVWAPWMTSADAALLIDNIGRTHVALRQPTAAKLGERLSITNAEREWLRLWTIAPCDVNPEDMAKQRKAKRRARDRERKRAARAAQGRKLRVEWERESVSRKKPWIAAGISRRTWYRRLGTSVSTTNASKTCGQTCAIGASSSVVKRVVPPRAGVKTRAKRLTQRKRRGHVLLSQQTLASSRGHTCATAKPDALLNLDAAAPPVGSDVESAPPDPPKYAIAERDGRFEVGGRIFVSREAASDWVKHHMNGKASNV